MTVIDAPLAPSDDRAGVFRHQLLTIYPPPDYVKQASETELLGDDTLPNHLYADQAGRRYACHNPAATWMSSLFLYNAALPAEKRAAVGQTKAQLYERRLHAAAEHFSQMPEIEKLATAIRRQQQDDLSPLPDDSFALVADTEGLRERHYPLRNPEETKAAAAWLLSYRDDFEFSDRRMIAERVLAKAAAYGLQLEQAEDLRKIAGDGYAVPEDIRRDLQLRLTLLGPRFPKEAGALRSTLASMTDDQQLLDVELRRKIAGILDGFDRKTRLVHKYGSALQRPEDMLFAISPTAPAEALADHVRLATGSIYKKAELAELPKQAYQDHLGTAFADAVTLVGPLLDDDKLAVKLAELDYESALIIDQFVKQSGLVSVYVDHPTPPRLTPADLQQLATQYEQGPAPVLVR